MPKTVYLYSPIYSSVISDVLQKLDVKPEEDTDMEVNSPGGDVFASFALYARMKELSNVNLKVYGCAMSAAAFFPFYAKTTECLDVTRFLFHRADMYVENETEQAFLDSVNKDMKSQMLKVVDPDKWKEVTGTTIDELFDPKTRIDVTINGKQAKELGIVDKVTKLTPEREKAMAAAANKYYSLAAIAEPVATPSKQTTMTKEELKAKFPELYAQVIAIGVTREYNRISAFVPFITTDPVGAKAGIESKVKITEQQRSEFALKAYSSKKVGAMKGENAEEVVVNADKDTTLTEDEKTKAIELAAFEKSVNARLGK